MRDNMFHNDFDAKRANDAYVTVVDFIASLPPGQETETLKKVRDALEVLKYEMVDQANLKAMADQCEAVMKAMDAWNVIGEGLQLKLDSIQRREDGLIKLMSSDVVKSLKNQMENASK